MTATAAKPPATTHSPAAEDWIPAPQILPELHRLTGQNPPVGARRLLDLAASARVAMEQRNGRWGSWRKDLPEIADALGMTMPAPVAAKAPRGRRPAEQQAA